MLRKKYPKLSVVIPTRERADTLGPTLKTVTAQQYENLEIIVSDNASSDHTQEVVRGNSDSRIKYTNTGNRIGMSENWENGLMHATGEFVMFLGDDDGLLPNACHDVANILSGTNAPAIIWRKPDYTWPSVESDPNRLTVNFSYELVEMNGEILLREISSARSSYGRLPVLYSGFVSMSHVDSIRNSTGRFFNSVTPDVYSGIVLAQSLKKYLYSLRPFSINGGSSSSNGINQGSPDSKIAKLFFSENGLDIHEKFPVIPGSIASCVAEAFTQAAARKLVGGRSINAEKMYWRIFQELSAQPFRIRQPGLMALSQLDLPSKLGRFINQRMAEGSLSGGAIEADSVAVGGGKPSLERGTISINCDSFGVENAFDACELIGTLFGAYRIPSNIVTAGYLSYFLLASTRRFSSQFKKVLLPF